MKTKVRKKVLLKAHWRELVLLNFEVDPKILQPLVPPGTELDFYNDHAYVSLIGMSIRQIRLFNIPIVLLKSTEKINLRFYVKRNDGKEIHRGSCFIHDSVSTPMSARVFRWVFKRPPSVMPIKCQSTGFDSNQSDNFPEATYRWEFDDKWNKFRVKASSGLRKQNPNTKEHFFLQHANVYVPYADHTMEYPVEHPPWLVWDAASGNFDCDPTPLFGDKFGRVLMRRPASVILARGSEVVVFAPNRVNPT